MTIVRDHLYPRLSQDWYPAVTAGVVTVLYLMVYSLDPSMITLVSLLGLLVTLLDYTVPKVVDKVFPRSGWTEAKERKLERVARTINSSSLFLHNCCNSYQQAKIR